MPKDIIDVVDTAVKIGLGALISGITTYYLTNKAHENDKNKAFIEKKISILEYSIESIEPYLNSLSKYFSRIDGALRLGEVPGGKTNEDISRLNLIKYDNDLLEARPAKSTAFSRLKLIGAEKITKHLSEIEKIENEFRQVVVFDKRLPDYEQLIDFKNRVNKAKKMFYKSLENEFSKTYS